MPQLNQVVLLVVPILARSLLLLKNSCNLEKMATLKNKLTVRLIKVCQEVNFTSYLHLFSQEISQKICSYHFIHDQRVRFVSEFIKHYYLMDMVKNSKSEVSIKYNMYGKPYYMSDILQDTLAFNISHSHEYLAVVFCPESGIELGIDIEYIDKSLDYQGMMPFAFSAFEQSQIKNVDDFFKLWTRKEALIKAYGTGFGDEWYQSTRLTLDDYIENKDYLIYTQRVANDYFLSTCVLHTKK